MTSQGGETNRPARGHFNSTITSLGPFFTSIQRSLVLATPYLSGIGNQSFSDATGAATAGRGPPPTEPGALSITDGLGLVTQTWALPAGTPVTVNFPSGSMRAGRGTLSSPV